MSPPADDETVPAGPGAPPARGAPDDTLPPRSRIGDRYEIVDCLGSGGMGVVYLALDEALAGKPVALKVVARALADDTALAQLRREVLLAQQVTHRNVCRIYDLEQLDGRWMIKMEVVSGETLAARLARRRLDVDEAVGIARQIADGLGAAHAQGVIHRDLKPSNVMIEEHTGRVVLMDFGIARPEGADAATDRAGTPAYMAPEQVRGERIDARADLYALGCVLYQMLVGAEVFGVGSTAEMSERQVEVAPPDARTGRPDVPSWLARAIRRLLEKDPARRPASAAAVQRLLVDPSRRRVAIGLGVAAGAAVIAVVAVATTRPARRAPEPWQPVIREIEPAYDENADSVAFSPDGTAIVTSSDRERPGWLRGRIRPVDGTDDDLVVTPPEMSVLMVSWSRDGNALLFTDIASGMKAYRLPFGRLTPELIGDGYAIACGDDLMRYEFGSPGCPTCPRFVLRDAAGVEREVLRLDSNAFVTTYRCDRAGRRLVWSRAELGAPFYQPSDLWLADIATGATRQLTHDRKRNCYPTFTPDGRSIVFTSARGGGVMNLWEMPLDGGAPRQLTSGNGNDLLADVSPDGSQVVFTVDVTSAPLFAYAEGGARRRVTPSRVILIDPQVTPDGTAVIAADFAPLAPRIVRVGIADGAVRELGAGAIATITPDGRDVVYVADGVPARLFAVPLAGGAPRPLGELAGRVRMLRAGPDGVVHAMVDRETAIEAWRVPLGGGAPAREADAPWCFVQPAPAGGWSMWMRCAPGAALEAVAVAPGATPDPAAPGHRMQGPMFQGGDFTAAGDAFLFYDQPSIERLDLATGATTTISEVALYGATVSPDGKTIYTTEAVGSARRHLITNFGSRLRP